MIFSFLTVLNFAKMHSDSWLIHFAISKANLGIIWKFNLSYTNMLSNEVLRFLGEMEITITTGGHYWRYDFWRTCISMGDLGVQNMKMWFG